MASSRGTALLYMTIMDFPYASWVSVAGGADTHAGGRAVWEAHRDGSAEVSTDGLDRLRGAARLCCDGPNYPCGAGWAA
jgi:hypothetical protein